jgi:hypothetical protein
MVHVLSPRLERVSADPRAQDLRTAGKRNDSVHSLPNGGFERLFFPFAEARIRPEFEFHVFQRNRSCFLANAGTHLVPKRGRPFQCVQMRQVRLEDRYRAARLGR